MAKRKLKKINRKTKQAAFITTEVDGVRTHTRIPIEEYEGMNQETADRYGAVGTYVGGFTRFDYDTPTGELAEGEYGLDGVIDGVQLIQTWIDSKLIVIPEDKIINDEIDDEDEDVVLQLNNQ